MAQSLGQTSANKPSDNGSPGLGASASSNRSRIIDAAFKNVTLICAILTVVIILGVAFSLFWASRATIIDKAHHFTLMGRKWDPAPPDEDKPFGSIFGALPFIYGTLITSIVAMIIAVPLGVGAAIFLAELVPTLSVRWLLTVMATCIGVAIGWSLSGPLSLIGGMAAALLIIAGLVFAINGVVMPWLVTQPYWSALDHGAQRLLGGITGALSFLVELLAAVPSIVYGFWALKYLIPVFSASVEPWLGAHFGQIPFFAKPDEGFTGQDYLSAGVILALMVLPFITAISRDVLRTVPSAQREAAYGMGATQWETISGAVLRNGSSGIIGASMLGLGRALGETMAVTIVIGSAPNSPIWNNLSSFSLMRPGYTMSAVLADQYPNPNTPLHASALTEIALLLFIVTIIVNALARGLVWLTAMKAGGTTSAFNQTLKDGITNGMKWAGIGLAALLFAYQIGQDVHSHGIAGLFGVASLLAIAIIAVMLFNSWVPGKPFFLAWRKLCNGFALTLCNLCVVLASGALLTLLYFVARDGMSALNPQFFKLPNVTNPELGGMLHAIIGTGILVLFASLFGIPFGILGGLYLAEFGNNKIGGYARFAADLLNGVPSIVIGIFAYTVVVQTTVNFALPKPFDFFIDHGSFGTAGAFALGVMMIPTVMRTTEELVRLVPNSLREGSLALGATRAYTTWKVILPAARSGIITGALLAIARIAGETAPLLMVLCNSSQFQTTLSQRLATLPVQIYVLRDEPSELALKQSWGVALTLVVLVLVFSILARLATRNKLRVTA